ncbi:unnamed protein product [Lactuca virosa]|uniref:Transposase n=1 Tax=Lactuca virosa TaxID=75947 RepID=A0AAU9MZB0_9ASTR|nr:unnamed protein product [Lactuca virosa]
MKRSYSAWHNRSKKQRSNFIKSVYMKGMTEALNVDIMYRYIDNYNMKFWNRASNIHKHLHLTFVGGC